MALLPIDATSMAWHQVLLYAQQRRAELAAECCAMATSRERREELAARIAELDDLVAAPAATKLTAELQAQPANPTRSY